MEIEFETEIETEIELQSSTERYTAICTNDSSASPSTLPLPLYHTLPCVSLTPLSLSTIASPVTPQVMCRVLRPVREGI